VGHFGFGLRCAEADIRFSPKHRSDCRRLGPSRTYRHERDARVEHFGGLFSLAVASRIAERISEHNPLTAKLLRHHGRGRGREFTNGDEPGVSLKRQDKRK